MALKEDCNNCKSFNPTNGLCTKKWSIPEWDGQKCDLTNDAGCSNEDSDADSQNMPVDSVEDNMNIECQENVSNNKRPTFPDAKHIFSSNPISFLEQQLENEILLYKKVYRYKLNYYFFLSFNLLLALPTFCLSIWLIIKLGIIIIIPILLLSFAFVFFILRSWLKDINIHKYDGLFVTTKKVLVITEGKCFSINTSDISGCDFNLSANRLGAQFELVLITNSSEAFSFNVTRIGVNLWKFIDAINQSAGKEIINKSAIKRKRIIQIISVIMLFLIYFVVKAIKSH